MSEIDLISVESSREELVESQRRLVESVMKHLPDGASTLEIAEDENAVIVRLASSVRGDELKDVHRIAAAEPVKVKVQRSSEASLMVKPAACSWPDCGKPLRGGVGITAPNGDGCSAGFHAVAANDYSQKFIITAGHCPVLSGGGNWSADDPDLINPKAIGAFENQSFGRLGDYAKLRISPTGYWNPTALVGRVAQWGINQNLAIGGRMHPKLGNTYCRSGAASKTRCGLVTATDLCVAIQQAPEPVCGMWRGSSCSSHGDSGGPAVDASGYAIGITSAGPDDPPCEPDPSMIQSGTYTIFQDVIYAEKQLGLRVVTEPTMGLGELPNGKITVVGRSGSANDLKAWNWNPAFSSGWTTAPIGGAMGSSPGIASWGAGRLDLFYKSPVDSSLHHRAYQDPNSIGPAENLGGAVVGGAGAVSWGPDRLDVFVRGTTNNLYQKSWISGIGWTQFYDIGGQIGATPAVASWGAGRLDVFAKGLNDDNLYHRAFDNGQWYPWEFIAASIDGAPAAVSWGPNRIDIFARDKATGNLMFMAWDANHWTGWSSWGGPIGSAPAAASWSPGRLDVFAKSTTGNNVMHRAYAGGQLYPWETLPDNSLNDAPAAVAW
jgi:hypothetical protein